MNMAYYDEPIVDPLDFDSQQQQLEQQAARIKALRARADAGFTPDNTEVGGFTLSTGQRIPGRIVGGGWGTAMQALAPLVAGYTADKQQGEMNQNRTRLNKAMQADALQRMSQVPQGTPYSAKPLNPNNPMQPGGGNLVEADVTQAQEPTQAEHLAFAMKLMENPLTRDRGLEYAKANLIDVPKELRAAAAKREEEVNKTNAQFVIEQQKAQATAAEKALDRKNQQDVARIYAEGRQQTATANAANKGTDQHVRNEPDPANPGMARGVYRNMTTGEITYGPPKEKEFVPNATAQAKNTENQGSVDQLANLVMGFKPEYAQTISGVTGNTKLGRMLGTEASGWWTAANKMLTQDRHKFFGSAMTPLESRAFNQISIDSLNSPEQIQAFLADSLAMAQVHQARRIAQTENPGTRQDPKTGEIILKDGTRVEGTATPQLSIVKITPDAPAAPKAPPPQSQRSAPAATSPTDTIADPTSALAINTKAFTDAQSEYKRNPTPANQQKLDLARADLDRARAANAPAAAPPAAPLQKSKNKAEIYKQYGL